MPETPPHVMPAKAGIHALLAAPSQNKKSISKKRLLF
jgi:hypothetical protein